MHTNTRVYMCIFQFNISRLFLHMIRLFIYLKCLGSQNKLHVWISIMDMLAFRQVVLNFLWKSEVCMVILRYHLCSITSLILRRDLRSFPTYLKINYNSVKWIGAIERYKHAIFIRLQGDRHDGKCSLA